MAGVIGGIFGVLVWLATVFVLIGVVAFMANFGPYKIDGDGDPQGTLVERLAIDVGLAVFFFVPHSIFVRPAIKKALGETPTSMYRTIYVAQSSLALTLIVLYWQPVWVDIVLWDLEVTSATMALTVLVVYVSAFVWIVSATFATDHFEFFGVVQSTEFDPMKAIGLKAQAVLTTGGTFETFSVRWHYNLCRHPIMLGFFFLFWCHPTMTVNHAFFSACCTLYILVTIPFLQEPELAAEFPAYKGYQQTTPMFCPFGCLFSKPPSAGTFETVAQTEALAGEKAP